ncbi:hypothetical protein FG386_003089 [Cryptosporidium ryanae]|uniref:uncharacterized protein n=1 Tax=Cryptosporidium ryanae TaxID=515981 RepID=UPI00351A5411|nr:hypothetical protein FG386_003089 [Cryptosporidium ryanae]
MRFNKKLLLYLFCFLESIFCNKVNVIIDESGGIKLSHIINNNKVGGDLLFSNVKTEDFNETSALSVVPGDNKTCKIFNNYVPYNECRKLAGGFITVVLILTGFAALLFQYLSGVPSEYITEDENSRREVRRCCCTYRVDLIEPKHPKNEIKS